MSKLGRIRALCAVALSCALLLVVAAPPAVAGLPVVARGGVVITWTTTSFRTCASGFVDDGITTAGVWLFEIDGARVDGTPIRNTVIVSGGTFTERCFTVGTTTAAAGTFVANLTFVGAGTSDVTVVGGGVALWSPATPNHADSFGF